MKMVCPIAKKCQRKDHDDGVGRHCYEHEKIDSCKVVADGCPACVEAKEEKKHE